VLAARSIHVPARGCTILSVRYNVHYDEYDHPCVNIDHDACTDDDCTREHVHVLTDDEYDDIVRRVVTDDDL
jgi:hypothetical protein